MSQRPARCSAAFCLLSATLWTSLGRAEVSLEAERQLGRQFAIEAPAQLPLIRDAEAVAYVDRIGKRIVAALGSQPFDYQFAIVRDGKVNAFAVPGGYVFVHSGLLTRVDNDDELAGVLGHEVAHVNAHHLARQQDASKLMNYAALLGVLASIVQPAIGAAAIGASAAVQLRYQREFEQEADYLGAGYMRQAGYDPRGMLDFFHKLWEEQRTSPTSAPPYLLSHPLTDERLSKLEAVLRTSQWENRARPGATAELRRVQLLMRVRSEPAQDVVADYRRAVVERRADGEARYLLGYALLETGNYDGARETLGQARSLGYRDVDRELGRAQLRAREFESARALLARAVEVEPTDALAQLEYGRALEALDQGEAAIAAYRRAVEIDPALDEAHFQLGRLAGRAGHEGDGFFHLAQAYRLRGELGQALSQYERAIPLLPAGPDLDQAKAQAELLREVVRQVSRPRR